MADAQTLRMEMRRFVTPSTARGVGAVTIDYVMYWVAIVGAMTVQAWWLRFILAVLAGNVIAGLFVLAHDAAHNSLTPSPRLNKLLAYLCMLPSLHNFTLWRVEHNRHHHQIPNVQGMDSWSPYSYAEFQQLPRWRRALEHYYRSGAGFWLYYLVHRWWAAKFFPHGPAAKQLDHRVATAAFRDFLLLAAWFVVFCTFLIWLATFNADTSPVLALFYGFVVPFVVWNFMMGYTVYYQHTHMAVPWFRTRAEMEAFGGQEKVTVHIRYSRLYGFLTHDIMEHNAHHVHPLIPHYRLHAAQVRLSELVEQPMVSERAGLGYFMGVHRACKLYDYEHHRWLDFAGQPTTDAPCVPTKLSLVA